MHTIVIRHDEEKSLMFLMVTYLKNNEKPISSEKV